MANQFNIADLLPMPPWLGPPLPRFLGIYWPQVQGEQRQLNQIQPFFTGPTDIIPHQSPLTTYENKEEWEIEWTDDGLPKKVTVTREAKQS